MALPLETTHLIAQLRASYLTMADNDEYARRIIKPLILRGNETEQQQHIYTQLEVPKSPPITFNAAHHIQNTFQNTNSEVGKKMSKKRKKIDRNRHMRENKVTGKRSGQIDNTLNEEEAPDLPERPARSEGINNYEPIGAQQTLSYTKTIKGTNRKTKPNIVKFFHSHKNNDNDNDTDSDSDSDDNPKAPPFVASERNLELIEEEKANEDESESNDGINPREKIKLYEKDTSDAITIDSDFDVPVTAPGKVLKNSTVEFGYENQDYSSRRRSNTEDTITKDEDEYVEDDEEESNFTEDEDEDEDEDADLSSTDSAFTDIETDSVLESSMLLDSYNDDAYNSYSFGTQNDTMPSFRSNSKKMKKKKNRLNSLESQSLSKNSGNMKRVSSQTLLNSDSNNEQNSVINAKTLPNSSTPFNSNRLVNSRKNSFSFGKLDVSKQKEYADQPKNSNLSMLIQSKFKSSNINPLNYYAFASADIDSIHKTNLRIFLPPSNKPIITNLNINDNVAVSDCIGFILLRLSDTPDFKHKDDISHMNPNKWRLELVDEVGENYGSFGILDRTRLLSSYNNPKEIALCRIDNEAEITKNEQQAPLPMEFKQTLLAYERKQTNAGISNNQKPVLINKKDETVELKILKSSIAPLPGLPFEHSLFCISIKALIGHLLKEFCSVNGLDPSRYKLKEISLREVTGNNPITHKHLQPENTLLQGNLVTNTNRAAVESRRSLKNIDSVLDLESNTLELVHSDLVQEKTDQQSFNNHTLTNMAITPSESTNTLPLVTPPVKQLEDKLQSLSVTNKEKSNISSGNVHRGSRRNTTENIKRTINSNKYLDDIIRGKNPQLPTNINTIYFNWKVWRKKPTILNKIEKTLIIDGDYIHLTPSDVMVWKKNPSENPFLSNHQNQSQSHHHHYLHHYNYSNYYNSLMMKTSSFHITQITKLKQYKNSKNLNHFKIVIKKQVDAASSNAKDLSIKKKYDLEATNVKECEEIIQKIKWVLQVYNMSNMNPT